MIHIDDVDPIELDQGELRWTRKRLGAAAGARHAGLSWYAIAPGARSFPPHAHADEEEISVVLSGSGVSVQGRAAHAIAAGDVLVHPCDGTPHTTVAGPDGLEVLVFAEGSRTALTYMPRTKTMWAASRWLPADGPHPLAADAALGPLEIPAPAGAFPVHEPSTTRLDRLALAAGESTPRVVHAAEEEIAYVLAGDGSCNGEALRAGSVVAVPPGTERVFSGALELLLFGTKVAGAARTEDGVLHIRGLDLT